LKPDIVLVGPMMPHVMEALAGFCTIHKLYEAADKDAFLSDLAGTARAIGTNGHLGASPALMDALPKVEIIGCYGVGVDAIDLPHAAAKGIVVTNTPGVLTDDVANMAIALLLACSRQIPLADRYVREGKWLQTAMHLTRGIAGRTMGVVGMGRIGRDIARKAEVFGMKIEWHGPRPKDDVPYPYHRDLVDLARVSDFLVLACPGGEGTHHLVGRPVLDALGPEGTLINIARGSVVDEPAMVAALQDGRLGAAGLDVFDDEPRVPEALLAMDQVVLQPHQGSGTIETRRAMGDLVVDNLRAHFEGRPVLTPVT